MPAMLHGPTSWDSRATAATVFSQNDPSSGAQVNEADDLGTVNFSGGGSTEVVLDPQIFNFSTVSWQDQPLGQP